MTLRFHWRLLDGGEANRILANTHRHDDIKGDPDLASRVDFCREAEEVGIDSLLVNIGFAQPDPIVLSAALAQRTSSIRFMVAVRPGLVSPTLLVQQINTLSALSGGRVSLNIVAGHSAHEMASYGDHLDHDTRYARMDEFLDICNRFWHSAGPVDFEGKFYTIRGGRLNTPFVSTGACAPEIFLGGNSPPSQSVAIRHADCWVRLALPADHVAPESQAVRNAGKQVGMRMAVIARETREEALDAAQQVAAQVTDQKAADERTFVEASDSESIRSVFGLAEQEWLTPWLWTGAVRRYGAPCVALLGSYDEVADRLLEFGDAGVSQFILSGWPKWGEMVRFGREVIPRVRQRESSSTAVVAATGSGRGNR
jgi:alkanesulfonate monooxygenase